MCVVREGCACSGGYNLFYCRSSQPRSMDTPRLHKHARANYPSFYRVCGIPRRERVAGGAYNVILGCARVHGIIFIVAGHCWPKNAGTTKRYPGIVGCKWRTIKTREPIKLSTAYLQWNKSQPPSCQNIYVSAVAKSAHNGSLRARPICHARGARFSRGT